MPMLVLVNQQWVIVQFDFLRTREKYKKISRLSVILMEDTSDIIVIRAFCLDRRDTEVLVNLVESVLL